MKQGFVDGRFKDGDDDEFIAINSSIDRNLGTCVQCIDIGGSIHDLVEAGVCSVTHKGTCLILIFNF